MSDLLSKQLKIKILTPDDCLLDAHCNEITATTQNGEIGILPGHGLLMTMLKVGYLSCDLEKQTQLFFLNLGYLEVRENQVTVLSESCEAVSEIDLERAKIAESRAENLINNTGPEEKIDIPRAYLARDRARMRILLALKR